jgi:hypothetical protein
MSSGNPFRNDSDTRNFYALIQYWHRAVDAEKFKAEEEAFAEVLCNLQDSCAWQTRVNLKVVKGQVKTQLLAL